MILRNCVAIFSCNYVKICDFIVAREMPDSLTTTQLGYRRNLKAYQCINNDDRKENTGRRNQVLIGYKLVYRFPKTSKHTILV